MPDKSTREEKACCRTSEGIRVGCEGGSVVEHIVRFKVAKVQNQNT